MAKNKNNEQNGGATVAVAIKTVAMLLALVLVAYVVLSLVYHSWNPVKWTEVQKVQTDDNKPEEGEEDSKDNTDGEDNTDGSTTEKVGDSDTLVLSDVEFDGLELFYSAIAQEDYATYSIDARGVQSAYSAKVTLANQSEATDKTINLSVTFGESNDWLKEMLLIQSMSAKDYVQVSKESVQSGEEFVITCSQAFGTPIKITATAAGAEAGDTQATCSIQADYVARFGANLKVRMGYDADDNFDGTVLSGSPTNEIVFTKDDGTAYDFSEYNVWLGDGIQKISGGELNLFYMECEYGVGTLKDELIQPPRTPSTEWGVEVVVKAYGQPYNKTAPYGSYAFNDIYSDSFVYDGNKFVYVGNYTDDWGHGIDSTVQTFAGGTYSSVNANSNKVTISIYVTFTGAVTGESYRYVAHCRVNPKYMSVPAQSPSFNIGNIVF